MSIRNGSACRSTKRSRCMPGTGSTTPRMCAKRWRADGIRDSGLGIRIVSSAYADGNGRCMGRPPSRIGGRAMRALFVLGRAIFGGYFAWSGLKHFLQQESMSQYAAAKGVAAPGTAVPASGALLLAGGISVLAGIKPRQGLVAIIGFLVPVSLKMHRFCD